MSGGLALAALLLSLAAPAAPGRSTEKPAARGARSAPAPRPERIEVFPPAVRLQGRRAYRQLLVTGYFGGEARDLTHLAVYSVSNARVVRVERGRAAAAGDGQAAIAVRYGGREARVPVSVSRFAGPDPVEFQHETLAVLTKQGCAGGSCHGSPHGKGGFSLSLFGYDPRVDRVSLTRDGFNRRINVMEPAESLVLKKPLLEIAHGGGRRLRRGDAAYRILHDWIREGAAAPPPAARCEGIEIRPGGAQVLSAAGRTQQLAVVARFSDGRERDVTAIATYDSSHPSVAAVSPDGAVTGLARGQAAVTVRYLEHLESVHVTVVREVPGFAWNNPPENNFIDRLVHARLRQLRYLPSGTCSDETFVRRVHLDLTGLLPPADAVRAFLAESAAERHDNPAGPGARERLVDRLLATEEHARFWALKKADLMRVSPKRLKDGRAERFAAWLVDAVRRNVPYDRFARETLTAAGDTREAAAANYFLAIPTLEERTEMSAQLFMGSRLECARCHNHPFENWTMRDYYRIAAVFARTRAEKDGTVHTVKEGEARHPATGEVMRPWGMEGEEPPDGDRRAAFAAWLTRPGNPYFARVEANRTWAELLGRGIVEPVDDFRSSNPPANGPLLDALAAEFERSGYDRKHLIRLICASRAYQRSAEPNRFNETEETLFSRARVRLLGAEQLQDAISLAARVLPPVPAPDSPGRYATQRPYPERSSFTAAFGQPERDTACTCERQAAPTLLQALELLNGGFAYRTAAAGAGHYAPMENERLVEELYLSALARLPSARERETARRFLERPGERSAAVTDLVWAVLNTQEFLFQH